MTTGILVGILSTVGAAGIIYLVSRWYDWRNREKVVLEIDARDAILPAPWRLGLLFVRDGEGPVVNRETYFDHDSGGTTYHATVRAAPTGFEYKCFVDHADASSEDVHAMLTSIGMEGVTQGVGRSSRIFFLRPGAPVVKTPEGISNNFCFIR